MRFPWAAGGSVFAARDRYEATRAATNALTGEGGYTDDPASLYRRTLAVMSRLKAYVSLSADRVMNNIFPSGTQRHEMMPDWERSLRVAADPAAPSEERRREIQDRYASKGARDGMDIAIAVAEKIGLTTADIGGAVKYHFNTAAALDILGQDRDLIYQIAIEVPVVYIESAGKHSPLMQLVQRLIPGHVGIAVTHPLAHGFLCDDPESLTDRDALRI